MNEGKMYEVLKFVEHGEYCRQSMDCVHGMLLIDCMRKEGRIDKAVLFAWFQQIAVCADQYERSGTGKNYKYLNPYGIVISDEGDVFFLNTESIENAEVMKQMQKRAVRSHFIKPIYEMETGGSREADLFGYGNTMRFLLAYMEVEPVLTGRETMRLSKVSGRCIGEARKKYESFRQVLRDLPAVRKENGQDRKKHRQARTAIAAGAAVCLLSAVFWQKYKFAGGEMEIQEKAIYAENKESAEAKEQTEAKKRSGAEKHTENKGSAAGEDRTAGRENAADKALTAGQGSTIEEERTAGEERIGAQERTEDGTDLEVWSKELENVEGTDAAAEWMELYLEQHTDSGNRKAIEIGEKARLSVLWKLADAYGQAEMRDEQMEIYDQLIGLETDPQKLEEAGVRKMKLEAESGSYQRAVETGRQVLERLEKSEEITKLIEGYISSEGKEVLP